MRLFIAILLTVGLSVTAPVPAPIDHDLAARQFFGSVAELFRKGNHGELFDIIHAKFEHFYPEMVTEEQAKELRAAFITFREGQGKENTGFAVTPLLSVARTIEAIQKEIKRRIWWLNAEGKEFITKVFASFPKEISGTTQFGPLSDKFDAFRAKFESLSSKTQKKLVKYFEIFGHLDEVKALVTVHDRLLTAAQMACDNLPGFSECDHLKKVETTKMTSTDEPDMKELPLH